MLITVLDAVTKKWLLSEITKLGFRLALQEMKDHQDVMPETLVIEWNGACIPVKSRNKYYMNLIEWIITVQPVGTPLADMTKQDIELLNVLQELKYKA